MEKNPTTIVEVLAEMESILDSCISNNSTLGYFAYVYFRTTQEIQTAILEERFEDNDRMEIFDVQFANYYLQAYYDYQNGKAVSKSWQIAFDAKEQPLSVIQHIILGMNAHINLDLALTAQALMKDKEIYDIESDFKKVNGILFELVSEVQEKLNKVSFLMRMLDQFAKNLDEAFIKFGIKTMRGLSWKNAVLLWSTTEFSHFNQFEIIDKTVYDIGRQIATPKTKILGWSLRTLAFFESKNVANNIKLLKYDIKMSHKTMKKH